MISKILYDNISKGSSEYDNVKIKTFIPKPTDIDYKRGYIDRYFIQKSNDNSSYIFEINSTDYSKFNSNPFYKGVAIKWRISGEVVDVRESNRKSIIYTSKDMKNIGAYLANLLQFHYRSPSKIL
jgi:hypothetical protein